MKNPLKMSVAGATALAMIALFGLAGHLAAKAQSDQAVTAKPKDDAKPPTLLRSVEPVYPEEARKSGIEGTVILEATVDVKGAVQKVKILRSVPALDQAAIDAVKQWVYEPKMIDGKPTPVIFTVTVRFVLDKEKKAGQGVEGGVSGGVKGGVEGGVDTAGAVKLGGDAKPPTRIKSVEPVYPEEARKSGIEGSVILEATIDVKGAVTNVKILRSIPALDQAAVDAVKQWVYEPKIINGKPTPVMFTVTVRFTLKDKRP